MSLYLKVILIIFALAYFISPMDIIPDFLLPFVGWIDDGLILGTIVYLIRYGRLPNFFFKTNTTNPASNPSDPGPDPSKAKKTGETSHAKDPEQNKKPPHEILGVGPRASEKEVQDAYKEAVKKYHPDKVSHLGEEFSRLANEKFLEIQAAYDELMNRF